MYSCKHTYTYIGETNERWISLYVGSVKKRKKKKNRCIHSTIKHFCILCRWSSDRISTLVNDMSEVSITTQQLKCRFYESRVVCQLSFYKIYLDQRENCGSVTARRTFREFYKTRWNIKYKHVSNHTRVK